MRLKLFPKIAMILIFLATIPVMIVGWRTATLNRVYLESNILELHTNLANSLSTRIDLFLGGLAGKIRAFVEILRLQGMISAPPLRAFLDSNGEFVSISFVDPRGRELLKTVSVVNPDEEKLKDRSNNPVFKIYSAQKGRDGFVEPKLGFHFENDDPRLTIIFPYNPEKSSQGAVFMIVSLAKLWEDIILEGAGVGGGGREAFVVDEEGNIIAHSNAQVMARIFENSDRKVSARNHPIVREALQKKSIGSKEFIDEKGRSIVGAYSGVEWTGWVSVIQQPKETAYYAIAETRRRAIQIVVLSLLVAALVAFALAKNLSRPIFQLIEGARKIAQGKFDHSVSLESQDEMGDLARTFNEMTRELKRYNDLQVDRIIEEKTKTEAVIFSIADGIILTDRQGNIQLLNDRAVKIFSLNGGADSGSESGDSLVGKNLIDLLKDENTKGVLQEFLAQPESHLMKEISIANSSYIEHFQLSSDPVYTPRTGRNLGVVTVVHDVTLERQMDEMKESFLHSITHDLRNPMTSIMGFIKFMKEEATGPVNEKQMKMLDTMDRASVRLLGMINDILDSAKIEAGKLQVDIEEINMKEMLEETLALYRPFADRKTISIDLTFEPDDQKPAVITGDGNQLERVTGNLIANAIKFTMNDGQIVLALKDMPDRVEISIQDNGPGIPEDYIEKVFDKFQQVKGEKRVGTGLGLTICKYFVELHHGKIWVESALGKGSRFIFWIPKGLAQDEKGEVMVRSA